MKRFQRYHFYITNGIEARQLAGPPPGLMSRIQKHLPSKFKDSLHLRPLLKELEEEALADFDFNYRKAISKSMQLT